MSAPHPPDESGSGSGEAGGDRRPGAQYFASSPTVASDPGEVPLALPDLTLRLATDRGVFGRERVDAGTRLLLLESPPPPLGAVDLVDVGCGYGPIALTMAHRSPEATVWAVDPNERARALCRANAEAAGVADRVRVVAPDDVPPDLVAAAIWSNPPIRVGKAALHALLLEWLPRLASGGEAVLVVQKHLGADSLATWMRAEGWGVDRLVSRAGYRLLRVRREEER